METAIGVGIWVVIFLVWYVRNYPDRFRRFIPVQGFTWKWPWRRTAPPPAFRGDSAADKEYRRLVDAVESVCARDKMGSSDAALMVQAAKRLVEIEPASGQIWEAYALDSLETATIVCDDCRIPVAKTVKNTGVRIHCPKCQKWLALKNSKVTVIDPNRRDLEDWEH